MPYDDDDDDDDEVFPAMNHKRTKVEIKLRSFNPKGSARDPAKEPKDSAKRLRDTAKDASA